MTTDLKITDLWTSSQYRYRATAAQKRLYGGSTVTCFFVGVKGDERDPSKWGQVIGYGKTPGERATDAKRRFLKGERKMW